MLDETHDPSLTSWVDSANNAEADFPIQNLPFGVFKRGDSDAGRVGVAIGDQIVDVAACLDEGVFDAGAAQAAKACRASRLNEIMGLGRAATASLRLQLSRLLRAGSVESESARAAASRILVAADSVTMLMPASIGDYTDFYASIHHATNVGSMFRPDNPLLPNYKWVPIGYHGRASSIVVSETDVRRPCGQTRDASEGPPAFGPSRRLDYELEIGAFIGEGNSLGMPIAIDDATKHIFGLCLVNDWSARDVQAWEYQPLGPFLAKNFATSIAPWIVTLDALAPFRTRLAARPHGDPNALPYLASKQDAECGAFGISLEVYISTPAMRDAGMKPWRVSTSSFADMYWTIAQLVTHHASNGCDLRPGDLLASGTVSGPSKESRGCLLERTWRGSEPLELPTGEKRAFLVDGDEVTLRGYCEAEGHRRIGFGTCTGRVLPAVDR